MINTLAFAEARHRMLAENIANWQTPGYKAKDLKAADFTAASMKEGGYVAKEMKAAGFTAGELKDNGYSARELREVGAASVHLA